MQWSDFTGRAGAAAFNGGGPGLRTHKHTPFTHPFHTSQGCACELCFRPCCTQDVEGRLRAAFTPASDQPIDVFAVAEALSRGEDGDAAMPFVEFVPRRDFLAEVKSLLADNVGANRTLEARLRSG